MRTVLQAALVALSLLAALPAQAAPDGSACTDMQGCDSGFCADGVCCNRACDAVCESCLAVEKQSGLQTGTCGPARAGTDPADECDAQAPTTCGRTGSCHGLKAECGLWPQGTPCHDPVDTQCFCNSVTGFICTGAGACYEETDFVECGSGDYRCLTPSGGMPSCSVAEAGGCASPCAQNGDCGGTGGLLCREGVCVAGLPVKASCTDDGDCAGGHCTDGVCCNAACGAQCEACNLPGLEGTCSQVTGQPVAPRDPCKGSKPCAGSCGGRHDGCDYPGEATECGPAECMNDSVKRVDACDNQGLCRPGEVQDCGHYSCDPAQLECFTKCASPDQCAGGACDTSIGLGVCQPAGVVCVGIWSTEDVEGNVTACPSGHRCIGDGDCLSRCAGPEDCNTDEGFRCGENRRCEKPGAGDGAGGQDRDGGASGGQGDGSGGCAVHEAGHDASSLAVFGLGCALWLARRRRAVWRRAS